MKILVTGANGQLGKAIRDIEKDYPQHEFVFADHEEYDIVSSINEQVIYLDTNKIDVVINCAAYTNVDKCEDEGALTAIQVNCLGVAHLLQACKMAAVRLIHISTDYVFDGKRNTPYKEHMNCNPINAYGVTKYVGEQAIMNDSYENAFIVRVSWLYYDRCRNFPDTIIKKATINPSSAINIVDDQIGSPTYAGDLARFLVGELVDDNTITKNIWHYSNEGVCSWYDFGKAVLELSDNHDDCLVKPVWSGVFDSKTKRPQYSVMDKQKVKCDFNIEIPHWRDSLKIYLTNIGLRQI